MAQKKGFYKDAGLEVKIVQGPENGADSLVATGEGDFGVSFQDTMASYVVGAGALPVTAIAAIIQHNTSGIISLKDKGITSPVKIAGHTYATWETPIEQGIIKRCVEADGSDYNQVKMIPSTVADEVRRSRPTRWTVSGSSGPGRARSASSRASPPTTSCSRTSTPRSTTTRR